MSDQFMKSGDFTHNPGWGIVGVMGMLSPTLNSGPLEKLAKEKGNHH
jgi:hypothetical protein